MFWLYLAFALLLVLSGIFSASETAFTSLSPVQVIKLSQSKNPAKRLAARLQSQVDVLITTILIGNNLVNISATVLSTLIILENFGENALTVGTALLTLLIILFGEVVPKQVAISYNEFLVGLVAVPIYVFMKILFPLSWLVARLGDFFLFLLGGRRRRELSLEGILMMIRAAQQRGLLGVGQDRIVRNVFSTQTTTVRSVMTHRTLMFSLSQKLRVEQALPQALEEGFSRIPLYRDHTEEISGVVLLKDLASHYLNGNKTWPLYRIMKEAYFIPESRKVSQAFWDMQARNQGLAIVLDEYGGVAGLVTREDLLEEFFGEMYDEDETIHEQFIQPLGDGTYSILGMTPLSALSDQFKIPFTPDRVHTFGGLLLQISGRVPAVGEEISTPFGRAVVREMGRHRVVSALLIPEGVVANLTP